MPKAPTKRYWTVRSSSIHNRGIFAKHDIPYDSPIIEYVGEKITKAESRRRGDALMEKSKKTGCAAVYVFTLNKRYDIDGGKGRNPARYINHSCDPNCEAYIIRGRIWIYSLREIKAGEELTYNYGFDADTWDDHPCRCGSPDSPARLYHWRRCCIWGSVTIPGNCPPCWWIARCRWTRPPPRPRWMHPPSRPPWTYPQTPPCCTKSSAFDWRG